MSKRVADLLVETVQAAGVKTCYGIVGDTLNRIAHAIDRSEIDWVLAQPGPALLDVKVLPMQLVTPPFVSKQVEVGMAVYSTRAILHGKGHDVWEMVEENISQGKKARVQT